MKPVVPQLSTDCQAKKTLPATGNETNPSNLALQTDSNKDCSQTTTSKSKVALQEPLDELRRRRSFTPALQCSRKVRACILTYLFHYRVAPIPQPSISSSRFFLTKSRIPSHVKLPFPYATHMTFHLIHLLHIIQLHAALSRDLRLMPGPV